MQKYHGEEFNTLDLHGTTKKMRKFALNKFVVEYVFLIQPRIKK